MNKATSQRRHLSVIAPYLVLMFGLPLLWPGKWIGIYGQSWLVLLLLGLWGLTGSVNYRYISIGNKTHLTRTPLTLSIVIFACLVVTDIILSPLPSLAWVTAGYVLFGLALHSALVDWSVRYNSLSLPFWLIIIAAFGLSVLSLPSIQWKEEFRLFNLPFYRHIQSLPTIIPETIHPNVLAGGLVLLLPFLLACTLTPIEMTRRRGGVYFVWPPSDSRTARLICGILAASSLLMLFLTQSRGAYVAAISSCAFVISLRWKKFIPWIFFSVTAALILIAVKAESGYFFRSGNVDQGALGGVGARIEIWTYTLMAIHRFPYTGVGLGSFTKTLPFLFNIDFDIASFPHAHNLALQIGYDLGVPGIITYLSVLINITVINIGLYRKGKQFPDHNRLFWPIAVGTSGAVIALFIHGIFDAVQWGTKLTFLSWLLFSCAASLSSAVFTDTYKSGEGHPGADH